MEGDSKEVARAHLADAGVVELPDDWDVVTLGDLFTEDRGIAVGVMYPGDHDPNGVPLIKAGDLNGSIVNPRPEFRITKEKHHEYRRTALSGGELVMTLVGHVGQCAVVPLHMAGWNAARAVAVMRLADSTETHFVQQCLLSRPLQHLMDVWCNTTVQATLNLKEIRQLPLPWPPKQSRDAIAAFGKALDDKIELNRRMNATLETMARALHQCWFDTHANDVEDRLVQELIDDRILLIGDGYRAKNTEFSPDGLPFIRAGNLKLDGLDLAGAEVLSAHSVAAAGHKIGKVGDVAFTSKGTVGRITRVSPRTGQFVYSPQVCFWRSLAPDKLHPNVLYRWMNTEDFNRQVAAVSTQTDMAPYVSLQDQRKMVIHLPPAGAQQEIAKLLVPIDERITANADQSRTLATLRDTLLPKLLSGELSVGDGNYSALSNSSNRREMKP